MKFSTAHPYFVGTLAGIASALIALSYGPAAAFLTLLAPFPLMAAALAYGLGAGVIGSVVTLAIGLFVSGPEGVLGMAFLICLPSVATGALGALARPASEVGGPDDALVWFPLADVLFALCLTSALAFAIIASQDRIGLELAGEVAAQLAERYRQSGVTVPADFESQMEALLRSILPIIQPVGWVFALLANFYVALQLSRWTGLLNRPKDDWPTSLRMPRLALLPFFAALLGSFAPGIVGYIAAGIAGAFGAGFATGGFAMLHAWSRSQPGRFFILTMAYIAVLIFSPLLAGFVIAGLFDTKRASPLSPGRPDNTDHQERN